MAPATLDSVPDWLSVVGSPAPSVIEPEDQVRKPSFSMVRPPSTSNAPPIEPVPNSRVRPLPLSVPAVREAPP